MNTTLRSTGLCGIILFGVLFLTTLASPKMVEESAKGFVKFQIEKEVRAKHEVASQSTVASKALNVADQL